MANEKVNKVVFGDETLIDLTPDTVTASKLALGETAHDASGEQITGTMVGGASNLADLDDVNLTNLSNGQIIKYNSTDEEWQNADNTLENIGDVINADDAYVGDVLTATVLWIGTTSPTRIVRWSPVYYPFANADTMGMIQVGDGFVPATLRNVYCRGVTHDNPISVNLLGIVPNEDGETKALKIFSTRTNTKMVSATFYGSVSGTTVSDTVTFTGQNSTELVLISDLPNCSNADTIDSVDVAYTTSSAPIIVEGYTSETVQTKATSVALNSLPDVNLSNVQNGQSLVYDSTTQKWVNGEGSKERYSQTVSCAVGDTEVIFTDVTYSNTATYDVYSNDGTGIPVAWSSIVPDANNKVMVQFFKPLKNATSVYIKYWELGGE